MASIYGFTLKNMVYFQGRDFPGEQGNIYYNGKKVGWYNEPGSGAPPDIDFDGDFEQRRKLRELLKDATERYYKAYPLTGEYADLPTDEELFMARLAEFIDDEKAYKRGAKKRLGCMVTYTDRITKKQYRLYLSSKTEMEKFIAADKYDIDSKYTSFEDFIIK